MQFTEYVGGRGRQSAMAEKVVTVATCVDESLVV